MDPLWIIAQKIAKEEYEDEYGVGSWDDADKYEKEDYCMTAYECAKSTN